MTTRYEDFALRFLPDHAGGWTATIQHAPGGWGGSAPFVPPLAGSELDGLLRALEEQVRWSGRQRNVRPPDETGAQRPVPPDPAAFGGALFEAVFRGRVRDGLVASLARASAEAERGVALRLVFELEEGDPGRTEAGAPRADRRFGAAATALAALPWELIYDAGPRDYLSRNRLTPVVRFLDVERGAWPAPTAPPLAILVATAGPDGHPPLALAAEEDEVRRAWSADASTRIEFLPRATVQSLHERLREGFHVVHFIGHGRIDPETGEAALLFEDGRGQAAPVPGPVLGEALKGHPALRLVVLNACDSGRLPRRHGLDPYSGVAAALVLAGSPGVVAMQFPISDRAAITFSAAFYRALAAGDAVEAAVAEGRTAVYLADPESLEWATPALYLRTAPGGLLEGLVRDDPPAPGLLARIRDASDLIERKTQGFVGRQFVFDAVERFTAERKSGYFLLTGAPGIGKSAIVAELVRRRGWVHHFNIRRSGIVRPEAFLANTCAQLVVRHRLAHGSLPAEAERDNGFLMSLLRETSRRLRPDERCVLLIDALDESDRDGLPVGTNPLYLPPALPDGVFAVLTSRPLDSGALPLFDDEPETMALLQDSSANRADAERYVESYLGRRGIDDYLRLQGLTEAAFIERLTAKSEGNFMYLYCVLPAIERGHYRQRPLAEIPAGLRLYYEGHWRLMRGRDPEPVWTRSKVPVLAALMATRLPIPFDLISRFARVDEPGAVRAVLREWRPFLEVEEVEAPGGKRERLYSLYHESFHDFLAGKEEMEESRRVFTAEELEILASAERRMLEAVLEDDEESEPNQADEGV